MTGFDAPDCTPTIREDRLRRWFAEAGQWRDAWGPDPDPVKFEARVQAELARRGPAIESESSSVVRIALPSSLVSL
jgi:hypothetical protein